MITIFSNKAPTTKKDSYELHFKEQLGKNLAPHSYKSGMLVKCELIHINQYWEICKMDPNTSMIIKVHLHEHGGRPHKRRPVPAASRAP